MAFSWSWGPTKWRRCGECIKITSPWHMRSLVGLCGTYYYLKWPHRPREHLIKYAHGSHCCVLSWLDTSPFIFTDTYYVAVASLTWADFIYNIQGYFTGTRAIVRLPWCQRSDPKWYNRLDPINLWRPDDMTKQQDKAEHNYVHISWVVLCI